MTGDPRVLAPLQQAFKETDDGRVQQQIVYAWCHETGNYNIYSLIDSEIRAWTPPPAEPSIDQRVAELEELISQERIERMASGRRYTEMIVAVVKRIDDLHPEPTAPDDPVCARGEFYRGRYMNDMCTCGHNWGEHMSSNQCGECDCESFLPAPQPAPDLDPVRVDAAAKATYATRGWGPLGSANQAVQRMWIDDAAVAISTYLKDGGA